MPKATKKNKNNKNKPDTSEKRTIYADSEGQTYGKIIKKLGGRRFEIACIDGMTRIGIVRNARKVKIDDIGDYVIVSLRDFQQNICDVTHRYTPEETRKLQRDGILPQKDAGGSETITKSIEDDENIPFSFEDI